MKKLKELINYLWRDGIDYIDVIVFLVALVGASITIRLTVVL